MSSLKASGGNKLAIGSSVVSQVSNAVAGSTVVVGNAGTYVSSPYQAYSGMWGTGIGTNSNLVYSLKLGVVPGSFPAKTTWEWSTEPDPRYQGVEGYLALAYGNYDGSSVSITPKQVKNITAMSLNVNWTYTGSNASGLLSECYLTTTSHATGAVSGADPVCEVGFFPHNSPNSQSFAAGLTTVGTGSFTDINSVVWNVGQTVSGIGSIPYFVATRPSYVDFQGVLDFKSYFTFLTTSGKITGNEYFNGVAFGGEPFGRGASQLTINSLTPTYS